jgi:hypothetical protein
MLCGQDVNILGVDYIFLGYVDYKRLRGMFADRHGNTHVRWM